jgi:hypothetical protein
MVAGGGRVAGKNGMVVGNDPVSRDVEKTNNEKRSVGNKKRDERGLGYRRPFVLYGGGRNIGGEGGNRQDYARVTVCV